MLTAEFDSSIGQSSAPDTLHLSATTWSTSRLPLVNAVTRSQLMKTLVEVINVSEQVQDAGSEQWSIIDSLATDQNADVALGSDFQKILGKIVSLA